MHRQFTTVCLALLAAGLVFATPAIAGDESALQEEVTKLRQQVEALSAQQQTQLEQEIDTYLDDHSAWQSAAAKETGVEGVSITGRFTAVSQNTVGLDPSNRSIIAGDVDLDFWMQVTENLGLFVYLTGSSYNAAGPNFPASFPASLPTASTLGGLDDGIGVDGTVPVRLGQITIREAGIQWGAPVGENTLTTEIGTLDPRLRFGQTAFGDDENTQFINNNFDDSPAISWMSDSTGRIVYALHQWISFGGEKQFTVNWGYFNTPGRWWDQGQFMAQFSWKGEISGREMNARVMILYDRFFAEASGGADDDDVQYGITWDWLVTDAIGLFARFAANTADVNSVEMDFSIGAQWSGFMASRADDVIGLAFGYIKANKNVLVGIPEDTEITLEFYWKFMMEDGKLQLTPHILYVMDPGGGIGWVDDSLIILGLRIYVPF